MENKKINEFVANKPIKTFAKGGVTASVFVNDRVINGQTYAVPSVVVQRSYKDKQGQWQRTNNYGKNELQLLIMVAQEAQNYLFSKNEQENAENEANY